MKVLVVSLLRIGDFLQIAPTLAKMQVDRQIELHLLLNSGLEQAEALFPQFKYHFFPRAHLQELVVNKNISVLSAFDFLLKFIDKLNLLQFDEVQNWTHNWLSARLIDLIDAKKYSGVRFRAGKLVPISPEEKYMSEIWQSSATPRIDYVDALAKIHGVQPAEKLPAIKREGPIYLQIFTSDIKKNWPQKKWLTLASTLKEIKKANPEFPDVRILCSESEIEKIIPDFFSYPIDVLSFVDLKQALAKASLIVSGDTSIIHLAATSQTPIVGLYLGPANAKKTGPRQKSATILEAQVECSPCFHSQTCSQKRHLCSEQLTEEIVLEGIMRQLEQDFNKQYFIQSIATPEKIHTIYKENLVEVNT